MTLVINKLDVSDEGYYVAVIEFANYKTEALFLVKVEKLPGTSRIEIIDFLENWTIGILLFFNELDFV